jgi:hypothetical protein
MIDAVQILWSPAGVTLSALDPLELVDVTDGDTPNIRLPVRLLSVDTPEVTARTDQRAQAIDQELAQLAEWIGQGRAPIFRPLAEFLLPKLATGQRSQCPCRVRHHRRPREVAPHRRGQVATRLQAAGPAPLSTSAAVWTGSGSTLLPANGTFGPDATVPQQCPAP